LLNNKLIQLQKADDDSVEYVLTVFGKKRLLEIIGLNKIGPGIIKAINKERVCVLNFERKNVKLFSD
jgi:hypothetical protein